MKTKKRVLKKGIDKLLKGYLFCWITFIGITADSVGTTYDIILLVTTVIAIAFGLILASLGREN